MHFLYMRSCIQLQRMFGFGRTVLFSVGALTNICVRPEAAVN
jgi:hypothetical protein